MTALIENPAATDPGHGPPTRPTSADEATRLVPPAAGLAVVASSTAMVGLLDGLRWIGFVGVAVAVVIATAMLLRAARVPTVLVPLGQSIALILLLTAVFTKDGVFGVLPGPQAWATMRDLLAEAGAQVQTGIAPVAASTEILFLITATFGVAAVVVDVIAVGLRAPAVCGLVLLCVFAVPASLADDLLPWWTFSVAAASFALLLVLDRRSRQYSWRDEHQQLAPGAQRPEDWPATQADEPDRVPGPSAVPAALTVSAAAVVLALLIGATATVVGTAGRLPAGTGSGAGSQIGLSPFTALRGQLQRQGVSELFRVQGLPRPAYLRALTLDHYVPQEGWQAASDRAGTPLADELPTPATVSSSAPQSTIEIDNVGYRDSWLPLYPTPLSVAGVTANRWFYDAATGVAYTSRARRETHWTEQAVLPNPSPEELRAADTTGVGAVYTDLRGVDPRVIELAQRVTDGAGTPFDKVLALNNYFLDPANGFRYDVQTAPGNGDDALVDFLTDGKSGYCEQFASAMAVMVRATGVPARVAIGFTAGADANGVRTITTADAHAWVEVYFTGIGWITFDPTPLSDGRSVVPPYVAAAAAAGSSPAGPTPADERNTPAEQQSAAASPTPAAAPGSASAPEAGAESTIIPEWLLWTLVAVLGSAGLAAIPITVRTLTRRRRLATVAAGGPAAAPAGWQELLAQSWDRGTEIPPTDTVRGAARRMIRSHRLDEPTQDSLNRVADALEQSWYATVDAGYGAQPDGWLLRAVHEVSDGLQRAAPIGLRARLFPRSVLHPSSGSVIAPDVPRQPADRLPSGG